MRRHPSHYLTDEQLDRFEPEGINDPTPAWDCATCEDRTEVWTGRDEHDTGQPITTDCPDCTHQTRTRT